MSRLSRSQARVLAGFVGAVVLLGRRPAQAYPEFPGIVAEELNLSCLPTCLLCHTRPEGGKGFVKEGAAMPLENNRGFGAFITNLENTGGGVPKESNLVPFLVAYKNPSMICGGTMNSMNTQHLPCDSDGDGRRDIQELQEGTDPDVKDVKGPYSCLVPKYGCGASIAPPSRDLSNTGRGVALIAALGVGLALVRRFRR